MSPCKGFCQLSEFETASSGEIYDDFFRSVHFSENTTFRFAKMDYLFVEGPFARRLLLASHDSTQCKQNNYHGDILNFNNIHSEEYV